MAYNCLKAQQKLRLNISPQGTVKHISDFVCTSLCKAVGHSCCDSKKRLLLSSKVHALNVICILWMQKDCDKCKSVKYFREHFLIYCHLEIYII